jgi:hypothetical protein
LLGRAERSSPNAAFAARREARGLTAKARTERSSCRRDARRHRTLSERSSTGFYNLTTTLVATHGFTLRLCVRHSARREALLELFPDMATIKTTDSPDRSHRLCLGFDDE